MGNQILKYFGSTHTPYLHGHGEGGTEFLLRELAINETEQIMEVGVGTGATLVKIKTRYPKIKLHGIDQSEIMLKKAGARLRFCGIYDIELKAANPDNVFPFKDRQFDKVYAESVLGIQDGKRLEKILSEIYRVLKPGGRLILNETVWLPSINEEEISRINALCKEAFGISQANAEYPAASHWLQLLKRTGFSQAQAKPVQRLAKKHSFKISEWLSKVYTSLGKLKTLNPVLKKEMADYQEKMNAIYEDKLYMEPVLMTAVK